jgi:short-subunit dehydrogenase
MAKENQEHKGQLAVVTGASSGIGYELAKTFASNGFDLIVAAEDGGIKSAAATFRTFGVEVEGIQVDLASEAGVEQLYQKIQQSGKPVDSLVLNAGVGVGGEFIDTDLKEELNMIRLNVMSTVRLAKFVLKDMVAQGHGRILFTSSIAAEMPGPYYAVYAATKAFIQSFAEAIRFEVKDKGITITALQPGATNTNFFARANMLNTKVAESEKDEASDVAQQGFDALMAGKDHVVAGSVMNKVQVGMAKVMTEGQAAKMHASYSKPDSGEHSKKTH